MTARAKAMLCKWRKAQAIKVPPCDWWRNVECAMSCKMFQRAKVLHPTKYVPNAWAATWR